jgi:hypothetical protein
LGQILKSDSYFLLVFNTIAVLTFYIVAYRFVNKAFMSESILIKEDRFELIKKSFFTVKRKIFEISKISNLRFVSEPNLTKHVLAGKSFDYFG